MSELTDGFKQWIEAHYLSTLGANGSESLLVRPIDTRQISRTGSDDHRGLLVQDREIGWLFFVLPYEVACLEQQISQAIGFRSRLLRESNYTGRSEPGAGEDKDSSWRVGLLWLVPDSEWEAWQRHVLQVRRESGAAEELSLDAVRIGVNGLASSLDKHGLPRLLLQTRALLRRTVDEVESWRSADAQVVSELEKFSSCFSDGRAKEFARSVEKVAAGVSDKHARIISAQPRFLDRFSVSNFRNLSSFEVSSASDSHVDASAVILCGPNGTGKSSLAEAISLAAFGTSPRLEQYRIDADVRGNNPQEYVRDYVCPVALRGTQWAGPTYTWNGSTPQAFTVGGTLAAFDGVVLSQEDSTDFTSQSKEQLATQVLRGYSAVAESTFEWILGEERRAAEEKSSFTRKYGINNAVRLSATAYSRLAQQILGAQLPRLPAEFLDWLRFVESQPVSEALEATGLNLDWRASSDSSILARQAEAIARLQSRSGDSAVEVSGVIRDALTRYNNLATRSGQLRGSLERRTSDLRAKLDQSLEQIDVWGAWLERQLEKPGGAPDDLSGAKNELEALAGARAKLEEEGRHLRSRIELLDRAKAFVAGHWGENHPHTCPVCDSDVRDKGSITELVQSIQSTANEVIQDLRDKHLKIQGRQREIETQLKAAGFSVCPIAEDDRVALAALLEPFIPSGESVVSALANASRRHQLRSDLARLKSLPPAPEVCADVEREAGRITSEFIAVCVEADRALENPQAIADVKKAFETVMERVLTTHLPETLGAVWTELTLALTPASWLLPELPTLLLEQRGRKLSVRAGDSNLLARYIFNAAERHVLGLGWFFTSYVSRRRFDEGWMLLDDPASDMDQPSFREFTRFLETLLRLHRRARMRFTVILSLHQEDRALDAARATSGQLYLLGWRRDQTDSGENASVKRISLLAPGFFPITPEAILEAPGG